MNAITQSFSPRVRSTIAAQVVRAATAGACLLLGACASLKPTHTGFLQDYDSMHPSETQSDEGAFRKSGLDVSHYHAFMVEPVVFESAGQGLDPATADSLKAYYQDALRTVFAKRLQQVDAPGPDVLSVRAAVTGVRQAHPVVNALAMAAVFVPVTEGAASSEAEVVDSVSGERLAALQGVTNGGRAFLGGPVGYLETYGQARRALTRQADHLASVLFGEGKGPSPLSSTTAALVNASHDGSAYP